MRYLLLICLCLGLVGCQQKPKGNEPDNPYDYENMLFEITKDQQHFYLVVSDGYRSNDLANSFPTNLDTLLDQKIDVYGLPEMEDHSIAYYELTRDNQVKIPHFYGYPAKDYATHFNAEEIDAIGHQYFEEPLSEYNAYYGQIDALNHRDGLLQLSLIQALPVYRPDQYQPYLKFGDYQNYLCLLSSQCADYPLQVMQDKTSYDQYLASIREAYLAGDIPSLQQSIQEHLKTYQDYGSMQYLKLTQEYIITPIWEHIQSNETQDCLYVITIEHFSMPDGIADLLNENGYSISKIEA